MATGPNIDCPPMLLVVDVGNTQTHFGTWRDGELVEHWRFATVRESTADELGAALRSLLELRGGAPAGAPAGRGASAAAGRPPRGPERVDRVLDGAAARAGVGDDGRALPQPRHARRRARDQDRHGD